MSTAVFPLGMTSMPSSGYNHKSTYYNKQYISWKGSGINSNPVGIASGHIRPLTNNDPGNVFKTGFGLPRPIKHYRKGRVIPSAPIQANNLNAKDPHNSNIDICIDEAALINYNMNRYVMSSKGTSLGGGFGGSGLLNDLQDKPGAYTVKLNPPNEINSGTQLEKDCKNCEGVGVIVNYYPNKPFLEENPGPTTTNPVWCCNDERKAKRRSIYASTNIKQNYYTTHYQYLQNRCKTYQQKAFNFLSYRTNLPNNIYTENPYYISTNDVISKPGGPLSLTNTYLANCQPNAQIYDATENALIAQMLLIMLDTNVLSQEEVNTFNSLNINSIQGFYEWLNNLPITTKKSALDIFVNFISNPYTGMPLSGPSNPTGCQLVVYKPNNYQFATQGAVDSSTRNLKLNVDTISTNAASIQNYNNTGQFLITANEIYAGNNPNIMNMYKNKAPNCNSPTLFPFQNKKLCFYKKYQEYQIPISKPGTYRLYPKAVVSSNHFSQSPNTYNTPSGI
jgi:hypothetical protein